MANRLTYVLLMGPILLYYSLFNCKTSKCVSFKVYMPHLCGPSKVFILQGLIQLCESWTKYTLWKLW